MKSLNIELRNLNIDDLDDYFFWNLPDKKFHKMNGPYYKKYSKTKLKNKIEKYKIKLEKENVNVLGNNKIIALKESNKIIGEVNYYWKSQETLWLEVGIVIFNENYWGLGIGTNALSLRINEIFLEKPELVRIGISTWSGNKPMINLAKKLGLKKEACYRKARIVDGKYYDSVSYGILKKDWIKLN